MVLRQADYFQRGTDYFQCGTDYFQRVAVARCQRVTVAPGSAGGSFTNC